MVDIACKGVLTCDKDCEGGSGTAGLQLRSEVVTTDELLIYEIATVFSNEF